MNDQIRIIGDEMRIDFSRFDIASYKTFLMAKRLPEYRIELSDPEHLHYTITAPARFAPMMGVEMPAVRRELLPFPEFLFDDQREIISMALAAKRFAAWSGTGNGKTFIEAEFARQVSHTTGGRVLVVTMAEIIPQWMEMIRERYGDSLPIAHITSRAMMKEWCASGTMVGEPIAAKVGLVNYEKFNHKTPADQVVNELRHLAGIVLDESSRLKSGGGKQKWSLIKSARGIEYKLSCTATPAPNEIMEFASQASFLEKLRDQNEILWTYFTRDPKTHRWGVKPHAKQAFFEFMAGWSIYVSDPRVFGWRKEVKPPPEPKIIVHEIAATAEQRAFVTEHNFAQSAKRSSAVFNRRGDYTPSMFVEETNATSIAKLSQAAKGFVYENEGSKRRVREIASDKPAAVADIVCKEAKAGLQVLVWTVFDAESATIGRLLDARVESASLTGATKEAERLAILEKFRRGDLPVLISRASMLGYGMNFQNCGAMVFSGWTFSYEQFYQAVRRAYRHGQKRSVRVHIPIVRELEGQMYDAICRKDQQHINAIEQMQRNYIVARQNITQMKGAA